MRFDLHRLRLLCELERRGTIAAVADTLGYSSASVSQQLGVLQREVGVRLLEPDGRGVRLTPQAHQLVSHSLTVFDQLDRAEADLAHDATRLRGVVRVAAFQTALLSLLPTALIQLKKHHPELRVEVIHAESVARRDGSIPRDHDLVIDEVYPGTTLARSPQLHQHTLFEDPLRVAGPPSAGFGRDLSDYAASPWVMEPIGSPAREWAVAVCRAAGFDPDVQFESTDVVVHERLAMHGQAVAFLPDLLGGSSTATRHLLEPTHTRRVVATTRMTRNQHPAITAVRDTLRNARANATRDEAEACG